MEQFVIFWALIIGLWALIIGLFLLVPIDNPKSMAEANQSGINYYKTQTLEWELFHYVYSTTNWEGNKIPDMVTPDIHIPPVSQVNPPTKSVNPMPNMYRDYEAGNISPFGDDTYAYGSQIFNYGYGAYWYGDYGNQ